MLCKLAIIFLLLKPQLINSSHHHHRHRHSGIHSHGHHQHLHSLRRPQEVPNSIPPRAEELTPELASILEGSSISETESRQQVEGQEGPQLESETGEELERDPGEDSAGQTSFTSDDQSETGRGKELLPREVKLTPEQLQQRIDSLQTQLGQLQTLQGQLPQLTKMDNKLKEMQAQFPEQIELGLKLENELNEIKTKHEKIMNEHKTNHDAIKELTAQLDIYELEIQQTKKEHCTQGNKKSGTIYIPISHFS